MTFGKYRNTPLQDVPDDYLRWLAGKARDPAVRRAAQAELDDRCRCRCMAPEAPEERRAAGRNT
jgi:hypothetical protein